MSLTLPNLSAQLDRLQAEGGDANRLVIDGEAGWIAIWSARGSGTWTVTVSAGRQMPEGVKLPAERAQLLYDQGYRQVTAASAYRRETPIKPLMPTVLSIFDEVLQTPALTSDLRLGDAPMITNHKAVDRMRAASRDRSIPARNRLYHGLISAQLLVATDGAPAGVESALRAFGSLGGLPTVAAYTDWAAALKHDARGPHLQVMRGMDLFPLLVARKTGSLRINPAGPVGGELYGHELWTVAEGCKRLSGVH